MYSQCPTERPLSLFKKILRMTPINDTKFTYLWNCRDAS